MVILGLDPGYGTMGYGIIERDARGNCFPVDYGAVKTPAGIAVAHARGVMLLTCNKRCGRIFEYTPNQIKQALTGYGGADKGQMQRVVASHLRLKTIPRPDDAADALAVALCHAFTNRFASMFGVK